MQYRKWRGNSSAFVNMKFRQRIVVCTILIAIFGPFLFWKLKHSNDGFPIVHRDKFSGIVDDNAYFDLNGKTHWHAVVKRVKKGQEEDKDQVIKAVETKTEKTIDKIPTPKPTPLSTVGIQESPWKLWKEMVESRAITPHGDSKELDYLLKHLRSRDIMLVGVGYKGTQLKATFYLEGNQRAIFKPMRYSRDFIVEGTPYAGFDRHNAEIAAFHLDRILGFYRAPPVVGRRVNLANDVEPVAEDNLLKTFYTEDGNRCFYGVCYYCKKAEAACAEGNVMEGSLTIWLPEGLKLRNWRHPWMRTYRKNKKAKWETNNQYCKDVVKKPPYDQGPRLMDIMDTAVFDFLIGNADRHHYETFLDDGDDGMLIHLDNAKSFGNPHLDEMSILAPIYQCCRLRKSTWERLLILNQSDHRLSDVLRKALSDEPVAPVLSEPHLKALDRRLRKVINVIEKCTKKNGSAKVLVTDR